MRWRGLHEDVLSLLAHSTLTSSNPDDAIEKLSFEAFSLTQLQRYAEAEKHLIEADKLCSTTHSLQCGEVLYVHGTLELERGRGDLAKEFLSASLEFAQSTNNPILQASSLNTLARVAAQAENHNEALELYQQAYEVAEKNGLIIATQRVLVGLAWEQYSLGNLEKAFQIVKNGERDAARTGNQGVQVQLLTIRALIHEGLGELNLAEASDLEAIQLAEQIGKKPDVINASMDLARFYIGSGRPEEADRYASQARSLLQETGSRLDILNTDLYAGEAAALRHDWTRAGTLLQDVADSADSQTSMKWEAQRALANMYEAQGDADRAGLAYKAALALVEGARSDLKQEVTQLTFLANAARIYDDYIHFLVSQGRTDEALEAADWSRARTLQQGLEGVPGATSIKPRPFQAVEIARRANATLLFYWLGARESYLWAVSGKKAVFIRLPPKGEIVPRVERYRQALLALKDPLRDGNKDAKMLYEILVAPAENQLQPAQPVVLFTDGGLSQMNFETLVVGSSTPHYWIEDATILSAPSIRMFALARPAPRVENKLLLFGDSISPSSAYPDLPMAALEVERIKARLPLTQEAIFTRERATPKAYLDSKPEQFSYIHFASHGTASRIDALDSAVILSRSDGAEDSFKLYARDILRHPIGARLVTISACNSVGTQTVAGEGLVGLSWAFLRAGAHNAIGALWEVNDASTPQLMDQLYGGLEQGQQPADALRAAKLSLVHSTSKFHKPFYWAPFQLYAGR